MFLSSVCLVLLLTCSFMPSADAQTYRDFVRKHINPTMNVNQCDNTIRNNNIVGPYGSCKNRNSFILAQAGTVQTVCGGAGTHVRGNLYKSNQPFPVVTCRLQSGTTFPNCRYNGRRGNLYITVSCERGLPVHYEEESPVMF